MFKHILLPTDGSQLSNKATKTAIQLAKSLRAKLTVFHALPEYSPVFVDEGLRVEPPAIVRKRYYDEAGAAMKKRLAKAIAAAAAAGVVCKSAVVPGSEPHDEIIKYAKKAKCDLVVMATHGRKGLAGILVGSETVKVVTHSTVPVLVVRPSS